MKLIKYDNYIEKLNEIFEKYNFGIKAEVEDFNYFNEVVTDSLKGSRISKHLTNHICPPIHEEVFYHYTKIESGKSILLGKSLRLYSVKKRITEDEIKSFLEKFKYKFPLSIDEASKKPRYIQSIADGFFYTSMTDTNLTQKEEEYFWEQFAGSDGVRFKFKIQIQTGCLRKITYGNNIDHWANFHKEIQDLTKTTLGKVFYWEDSSSVCGLYLPHGYSHENETRLVIKRSWGLEESSDGKHQYVTINFGENPNILTKLELIEVQTNHDIQTPTGVSKIKRDNG